MSATDWPKAEPASAIRRISQVMVSRATRSALVLALFPLALIGWLVWDHAREVQRLEVAGREAYAQAEALKREVEARFSPGANRSAVEEFLHTRMDYGDWSALDNVFLLTGKTPSKGWGCGPFSVGLSVQYRQQRFESAKVEARGDDCM